MTEKSSIKEGFFDKLSWKVLLIIGVVALGLLVFSLMDFGPGLEDNEAQDDNFSDYASGNESRGTTDVDESTITAEVNITKFGVAPTRAEVGVGESVRWINSYGSSVYVEFSNIDDVLNIEPGETNAMRFRGVTRYEVKKASDDSSIGQGTVYVE